MLKGFVIGFFCFILFLILHLLIFHNRKFKQRFVVLVIIFCSLLPIYFLLYILIPSELITILPADSKVSPVLIGLSKIFNFFLGLFTYLLLFFGYCQFYFIVDRSISVRIMIELENSKNKKLTLDQIKQVYSPDHVFLRRLKEMIDSRFIVEDAGSYKNTRKGKIIANFFQFLKGYLQLGEGG